MDSKITPGTDKTAIQRPRLKNWYIYRDQPDIIHQLFVTVEYFWPFAQVLGNGRKFILQALFLDQDMVCQANTRTTVAWFWVRLVCASVVYKNSLWIFAGYGWKGCYLNDLYEFSFGTNKQLLICCTPHVFVQRPKSGAKLSLPTRQTIHRSFIQRALCCTVTRCYYSAELVPMAKSEMI